jgi:hypothetical protein
MVAFFSLHTHHISKGRKAITCAIGIANMNMWNFKHPIKEIRSIIKAINGIKNVFKAFL